MNNPYNRQPSGGEIKTLWNKETESVYYNNIKYHSLYNKILQLNNDDVEVNEKVVKYLQNNFEKQVKEKTTIKNGKVVLFRAIALDDINNLDTHKLGIYWANKINKAGVFDDEGYEHIEEPSYENIYVLKGEFDLNQIDWQSSFVLFIMNDWLEGEVRVKDGALVKNLQYKKEGALEWINLHNNFITSIFEYQ